MLEEILEYFALPAAAAVMVGDSSFDLQMASNAGMDSVAVGYGAQSLEGLRAHRPVLAVEHFDQLRHWLESGVASRVKEETYVG